MRTLNRFVSIIGALANTLPTFGQTITSVAGNSSWGPIYNVSLDAAGILYAADLTKHQVYKIDLLGLTTVIAGTGRAGFSGDGALASAAQLNGPAGTAVAPDGTVYIADSTNDRIRKIAPNGIITTIVGPVGGFLGDGGPATAACLNSPISLVLDPAGNLYITDALNLRIRKITPAGIISTIAGTGRFSLSGDGGPATAADAYPCWLAVGPDGSLYFTDDGDSRSNGNKRLRRVSPTGVISTVAGTGVGRLYRGRRTRHRRPTPLRLRRRRRRWRKHLHSRILWPAHPQSRPQRQDHHLRWHRYRGCRRRWRPSHRRPIHVPIRNDGRFHREPLHRRPQ